MQPPPSHPKLTSVTTTTLWACGKPLPGVFHMSTVLLVAAWLLLLSGILPLGPSQGVLAASALRKDTPCLDADLPNSCNSAHLPGQLWAYRGLQPAISMAARETGLQCWRRERWQAMGACLKAVSPNSLIMIHFTDQLHVRLTEELQRIALESENHLQRAERSCRAVEASLEELKAYTKTHAFPDQQAEITFFKEVKPRFLKELFYFIELFYLEAFQPVGGRKKRRAYLQQALDRVSVFFDRHQLLYTYYRMNQSHLDHLFFLRGAGTALLWPDSTQELDPCFSTLHSHQLARLQASEALRDYLQGQLQQLDRLPEATPGAPRKGMRLAWTASKASLIELAYALRSRGRSISDKEK